MKIEYYVTYSHGGVDGREQIEQCFETDYLAKLEALSNDWNDDYSLYKETMIIDETVSIEKEFLGKIRCWRSIVREYLQNHPEEDKTKVMEEFKTQLEVFKKAYEKNIADLKEWKNGVYRDNTNLNNKLVALEGMKDVFGEEFINQMVLRLKVEKNGIEITSKSNETSDSPYEKPSTWKTVLYLLDGQYYTASFWEKLKSNHAISEYSIHPCTVKSVLEGFDMSEEQLEEAVKQVQNVKIR